MYAGHYNLSGRPFQLSPDPRFFYDSRSHQKAMAYLTFGLTEREGFIVITGEIGAGKTTLVRHLLSELNRDDYVSASVVTSQLEADDVLRMVASAFGLPFEGASKASLLRTIEAFLIDCHSRRKHVLLIVDEIQNMPISALEELRMLSNFQHDGQSLFQCFLLGQPEFRAIIASDALEQLRQRVIASCHLEPLDENEMREYIEHRLLRVGWAGDPSFDEDAFRLIYRYTDGVPRRINALCGRILLFGYLEDLHHIDGTVVSDVVDELTAERGPPVAQSMMPAHTPVMAPVAAPSAPMPAPSPPPVPAQTVANVAPPAIQPAAPPTLPNPPGNIGTGYVTDGNEQTVDELIRRVAALKGTK
jgi:putative secretion ATPase (PEP-CTERM system associated)